MNKNGNGKNGKKGKVLDLNTKILIQIRDELHDLKLIVREHTVILNEHTTRLERVESAVKELARETRKWVAHFDRDYLRLANEFDSIKLRVEKVEGQLARGN